MSPLRSHTTSLAAILVAAGLAAPKTAAAQGGGRSLTVSALQGITFGNVIPGVPLVVPYTDVARAGQFQVRGPTNAQVELVFTLPSTLAGPAGALMPVAYAGTSCGVSINGVAASAVPCDPRTRVLTTIDPRNGRIWIHLGAIAQPAGTQRAGAYTGTIVLTAALTGL